MGRKQNSSDKFVFRLQVIILVVLFLYAVFGVGDWFHLPEPKK